MNFTAPIQISFVQAEYERKKKRTRREVFLEKMDQVVPWSRLMHVIEPYSYPKSGKGGFSGRRLKAAAVYRASSPR